MSFEPYILFSIAILTIFGILLFYSSWKNFEILIFLVAISEWIPSLFYNNIEIWIGEEIATGPGGYIRGGILLFAGLLGLIKFIRLYPITNGKVPLHLVILFIFILYAIASSFYSIAPKTTFTRAAIFTLLFLFLLGLNSWLNSEKKLNSLMNTLFFVVTFLLVVSFLAMFISPARVWWWKTSSRFIGLWSHPNEVGGMNLVSYPIIMWKYYKAETNKKYLISSVLLLNFIMHFLTGSRTSLLAAMIGIFIWFMLSKDWIKIIAFLLLSFSMPVILSQLDIASFHRDEGSKITDISERDHIWSGAVLFAKEKPIFGYGYAVESKIFSNQKEYDIGGLNIDATTQQPLHNGYLSIFIGGGIIGVILYFLAIIMPFIFSFSDKISIFKLYSISTIIPILIANIVESAITGYLSPTDIFFWLAWIVAGKLYLLKPEKNKTQSNRKDSTLPKEILQNV